MMDMAQPHPPEKQPEVGTGFGWQKWLAASVLVIFVGVVLGSGGVFVYKIVKNRVIGDGSVREETKEDIAKDVLNWLDLQRDDRGVYYNSITCDSGGSCNQVVESGISGHTGLAVIWSRFKHYQATRDGKDLKVMKRDLDTYTDRNRVEAIQNDFENCSLMYEMWRSDVFQEEQKKKIYDICWMSSYYRPLDLEAIWSLEEVDGRTVEKIEAEIPDLDLSGVFERTTQFLTSLMPDDVFRALEYSAYPSDFIVRYQWEGNEVDLKKAKFFFNKAIQLYVQSRDVFTVNEMCMLSKSAVSMYQATQKKAYLDFAVELVERVRSPVTSRVLGKSETRDESMSVLEEEEPEMRVVEEVGLTAEEQSTDELWPVTCAIMADKLHDETGGAEYLDFQQRVMASLVRNAFDSRGYKGMLSGDRAFRSVEEGRTVGMTKWIRDNGLIAGMLAEGM